MHMDFLQEIEQWMQKNNWQYKRRSKAGILEMDMRLQCGLERCRVLVWLREGDCVVIGRIPVKVEEEARSRVAEYLCRVNYGLYYGGFDFNFNDGEIRYKTLLTKLADTDRQEENIEEAMVRPAMMFDMYGPGLLEVWKKEKEPSEVAEG